MEKLTEESSYLIKYWSGNLQNEFIPWIWIFHHRSEHSPCFAFQEQRGKNWMGMSFFADESITIVVLPIAMYSQSIVGETTHRVHWIVFMIHLRMVTSQTRDRNTTRERRVWIVALFIKCVQWFRRFICLVPSLTFTGETSWVSLQIPPEIEIECASMPTPHFLSVRVMHFYNWIHTTNPLITSIVEHYFERRGKSQLWYFLSSKFSSRTLNWCDILSANRTEVM